LHLAWDGSARCTILLSLSYVASAGETAVNVYRVEIDTGKRSFFTILSPSDKAGLTYIALCCVTPDGKFYAYSYNRQISELFIVEGLE
jgi:hypothetical protein